MMKRHCAKGLAGLAAGFLVLLTGCGREKAPAYEAAATPGIRGPDASDKQKPLTAGPATPTPDRGAAISKVEDALKTLAVVLNDPKLDPAVGITDETSATIMRAAKSAEASMEVYWGKFAEDGAVNLRALEKSVVSAAAAETSESRKGHLDFARKMLSQLEVRAERMRNAAPGSKPKND